MLWNYNTVQSTYHQLSQVVTSSAYVINVCNRIRWQICSTIWYANLTALDLSFISHWNTCVIKYYTSNQLSSDLYVCCFGHNNGLWRCIQYSFFLLRGLQSYIVYRLTGQLLWFKCWRPIWNNSRPNFLRADVTTMTMQRQDNRICCQRSQQCMASGIISNKKTLRE